MNEDKEINQKLLITLRDLAIVIVLIVLMVKCFGNKTSKTTSKSDIYICLCLLPRFSQTTIKISKIRKLPII